MTNNTTEFKYFTVKEALQDIKEVLENGYDSYMSDLHNEVFNTDYYIIGKYEAKQALNQYGVFEAIEEVQSYELDNFGEVITELSSPEKVANMLYFIKGYEAIEAIINKDIYMSELLQDDYISKSESKAIISVIDDLLED